MKPLVTFDDAEDWAIDYVADALAARLEDYANATVDVGFPTTALTKTPLTTYVQVEFEGTDDARFPVVQQAQIRFNCWAPKGERPSVRALASLVHGLVLAHTDAHPGTGPSDVTNDPTTGYLMVWFTALVDLRAIQLA